jgi:hypothetical protein
MEWRRRLGLPSRREIAEKRREAFKKLYLEGKTYREISKILGVKIGTVILWRRKLDLPPRWTPLTPDEKLKRDRERLEIRTKLLNLVLERGIVSFDEAAQSLNVDRSLINRLIQEEEQLEKLSLCFARSAASKVTPTMMFGNLAAKRFVYCRGCLEPVKQFLVKIVRENVKRPLNRGEVLALRYRLEQRMRLPKELVDDIICSLTFAY